VVIGRPDRQDPVVATDKPDEQKDAEKYVNELRREEVWNSSAAASGILIVVVVIQPLVATSSNLRNMHTDVLFHQGC